MIDAATRENGRIDTLQEEIAQLEEEKRTLQKKFRLINGLLPLHSHRLDLLAFIVDVPWPVEFVMLLSP